MGGVRSCEVPDQMWGLGSKESFITTNNKPNILDKTSFSTRGFLISFVYSTILPFCTKINNEVDIMG